MRSFTGVAAASWILLWAGCGSEGGSESPPPEAPAFKADAAPAAEAEDNQAALALESEIVRLVNAHRVSQGLNALVDSPALRAAARAHSRRMIEDRFVGHVDPQGLGAGGRLARAGIAWSNVGENIAAGYATPQEVFAAWMASPGHRAVIEDARWTQTGAGYAYDASPTAASPFVHYWTQDFMEP